LEPPYSITYNSNGGIGEPPDTTYHKTGETPLLSGSTISMTKANYNFAGWKINGITYKAGSVYPITTGNVTAYAKWTSKPVYVSAGQNHSMIVAYDGTLWATGNNSNGKLGDGTDADRNSWVQVMSSPGVPITGVVKVTATEKHTMIIKSDGTVWAMGQNDDGQLCNGTTEPSSYPVLVSITPGTASISSRTCHNLILKSNGELWVGGQGGFGQLGDGGSPKRPTPVQIMSGTTFISAAAGRMHSVIVASTGALYTTGNGDDGELGNGTGDGANNSGTDAVSFVNISFSNASSVAAGFYHTMVLDTSGAIWATGANNDGQLGDGTSTLRNTFGKVLLSGARAIACGNHYSMYINTSNTLYATGQNYYGQLGNGTTIEVNSWTEIMNDVQSVSAGDNFTFFFKTDGTLWASGYNYDGQLGNGTSGNYDGIATRFQVILP